MREFLKPRLSFSHESNGDSETERNHRQLSRCFDEIRQQSIDQYIDNDFASGFAQNQFALEVRETSEKGLAVFARKPIEARTCVLEYLGERLTNQAALSREAEYESGLLPGTGEYLMFLKDLVIDAEAVMSPISSHEFWRFGCFLNHASGDNANVRLMQRNNRAFFVTRRAIAKDEELAFDYGDARPEVRKANPWLSSKALPLKSVVGTTLVDVAWPGKPHLTMFRPPTPISPQISPELDIAPGRLLTNHLVKPLEGI